MLVLTRKKGESVVIGDSIRVTVVAVQGDAVRLGFVAPDELPIHREEVHRRIRSASTAGSLIGTQVGLHDAVLGSLSLHA